MKIKSVISFIAAIFFVSFLQAQVWFTKTGVISIYSHTEIEDIKANNFEVVSFMDAAKGELRFQLLIKGFQFPKAAMQQHFNSEAYMNSNQFPKSEFKGVIENLQDVNFSKDGSYAVTVTGDLTMHGVTRKIKQAGTITIKTGKVGANTVFKVKRSDYGITVPSFNAAKIADEIEVTVKCDYAPYSK